MSGSQTSQPQASDPFDLTAGQALAFYLSRQRIPGEAAELLVRLSAHPAVISAPHAKRHLRDGEVKLRDTNTAVLAFEAARAAGARSLVVTNPLNEDPNWDAASRFRRQISAMLTDQPGFLLDVHGMTDARGPDVILGTAGGGTPGSLVAWAGSALDAHALTYEVHDAGDLCAGPRTMTAWALEQGFPAMQLEFARRVRSPLQDPERFSDAVRALARIASWPWPEASSR